MTGRYCQACDYPQLMTPEDGAVRCPACGAADSLAVIRPLFVVTGASGSGKTTILPELLSRLAGWCAVFDVDWLIDPLGRAAGGAVDWTVFRDTWLHVAHGMAQNGLPTFGVDPQLRRRGVGTALQEHAPPCTGLAGRLCLAGPRSVARPGGYLPGRFMP